MVTVNIRFGNKQNLTELAEDLREVSARKEQPAPFDWDKIRQLLEDSAQYLETYIIPRTPDEEPGYKSKGPAIATFVPPERSVEVHHDDSSASVPFLASGANGAR